MQLNTPMKIEVEPICQASILRFFDAKIKPLSNCFQIQPIKAKENMAIKLVLWKTQMAYITYNFQGHLHNSELCCF